MISSEADLWESLGHVADPNPKKHKFLKIKSDILFNTPF